MNIKELLDDFVALVGNNEINIYNEFSLQHELGIYLRKHTTGYKIEFERNTAFFQIPGTVKHEIDIVIYNDTERYAIELKYPRNGQYPEQMFSFIKDIKFMEEMKSAGFTATYCLTFVENEKFYSGKKQDGIYAFFRRNKSVHGLIYKPTGKKDERITVYGNYDICWRDCNDMKYYTVAMID